MCGARNAARIEVVSLRPARIAAQIEVLSLRLASNTARIKVVSPRLARIAAHIEVLSLRPKRCNFAPARVAIIEAEIDKLLAAGFIEEVSYAEWLANIVLVAKKDKGLWKVCVDYTDLNKACPKDNFPLPRIDHLVGSTSGNQLLSFMDAYSGYNQIMMHEDNKAKTCFIIKRGAYCYKVMPFGLKNAGATYQRLVNKIFKEQIGKTMEVYVDDMLVKAPERADHIKNLAEAFSLLRKYNMKLNPSKCTFGVSSGRFLGYLVTQRGIEAHPNQIKAILNMKSPATTNEIQSLTGRAAALNRFLSRSTDKCRPFFKALKKGHRDKWDDECEVAFQNLKTYLTSPPLLSKLIPGEDLYIYLAVSDSAVSSALIRKELGTQHLVFYTSKALLDAEALAIRKWRSSFFRFPDASQRLMKWAIELSQYDLLYRPKTAIKAQVLIDFVVEFTPTVEEEKMVTKSKEKADDTSPTDSNLPKDMWQLHIDGASNHKEAGAGVVIITPDGTLLEQAITLGFSASSNEADYEALLAGLRLAKELTIKRLAIYSDSQLITNQASGEYIAKHSRMIQYLDKVQRLLKEFPTFTIQQVPRAENTHKEKIISFNSDIIFLRDNIYLIRILSGPTRSLRNPSPEAPINRQPHSSFKLSPRLARIAARIKVVSPRPTRIAAQIEVLSLRPARNAAWIEVASPRPVRIAAQI
ncbi:hypothetical protein L3X38_011845 [Prunus dulcis]|uniref:RNase H type-1 domain-containing protein n=1 Tax=Prunus dulcis TaxID=3755 RepID=A0AAD4WI49_PRUDU|nr:hypothetical protein L3X38_011845 [Prunus dulcis]